MNLQLSSTEEYMDGKSTGHLGQVLIRSAFPSFLSPSHSKLMTFRCNNVLWISAAPKEDVKMED